MRALNEVFVSLIPVAFKVISVFYLGMKIWLPTSEPQYLSWKSSFHFRCLLSLVQPKPIASDVVLSPAEFFALSASIVVFMGGISYVMLKHYSKPTKYVRRSSTSENMEKLFMSKSGLLF